MAYQYYCPSCNQLLSGDEGTIGQNVQCPLCNQVYVQPAPAPAQMSSPQQQHPGGYPPQDTGFPPQMPAGGSGFSGGSGFPGGYPGGSSVQGGSGFQGGPGMPPGGGSSAGYGLQGGSGMGGPPMQPGSSVGNPFPPMAGGGPADPFAGAGGMGGGGDPFGADPLGAPAEEKLCHIPCPNPDCPNPHGLPTPQSMLGQDAQCPHCGEIFRLRYEDSFEYAQERAEYQRRKEEAFGKKALNWAIAAAVIVGLGILTMIVITMSE